MITPEDLDGLPIRDNGDTLSATECQKIAGWLDSIFDDIEDVPRGAVGAVLCSEPNLLDSGRELSHAEIERILNAVWWEGARCGDEG